MRRLSTAILAIGIALVFVFYMVTYTVDYNQTAIVTTFGKATEPDPKALADGKDTGSVVQEPGLKFKWPWPIQRVQTYPTQLQVLSDNEEQLQLSDDTTIIISLNLAWRVENPLAFSISLGTMENAEEALKAQMRDLRSEISKYTFAQLVNTDSSEVRLDDLEKAVAKELVARLDKIKPSYGIAVAEVTVGKMLYTESTAESVNGSMTTRQIRKAEAIRSDGNAQAQAIITEADSISKQLNTFATSVASDIENIGINEANQWLARYAEAGANEDLAIYLRQLEALEQILANRTTFMLDARTFSPLNVLVYGHGGDGNLSRLFDASGDRTEPAAAPPSPVSPQAQADALMRQINALRERIAELQEQLDTIEAPSPVKTISTHHAVEDRP